MNVLLRKITIISDEEIDVLNETFEKTYFGKEKLVSNITKEQKTFEYWIEFHVDQERFYYGERKPVECPNRPGVYTYQTNTSHTKRGLDKSLEIISGIAKRAKIVYPKWDVKWSQIDDLKLYRQFDKDDNNGKTMVDS